MSKVYIVVSKVYAVMDERLLDSAVKGVFDSEEKAIESIKKHYGTDYCDHYESVGHRIYLYKTDSSKPFIEVIEWNVNESVWEDLA